MREDFRLQAIWTQLRRRWFHDWVTDRDVLRAAAEDVQANYAARAGGDVIGVRRRNDAARPQACWRWIDCDEVVCSPRSEARELADRLASVLGDR